MKQILQIVMYFLVTKTQSACVSPSVTTFSYFGKPMEPVCPGDLIFEENFNTLDTKLWPHEVTLSSFGNGEFEYYTDDRRISFVKNGILHIRPMLTAFDKGKDFLYNGTLDLGDKYETGEPQVADSCTRQFLLTNQCTTPTLCKRTAEPGKILEPVASARMRTKGTFSYRYGKLEARLKIPAGNWLWPALWLLPAKSIYGTWPMSGEIDVMESAGNVGLSYPFSAGSTLHWGPDRAHEMWRKTHYSQHDSKGFHNIFHTFQFQWTPDHISFSIDNKTVGEVHPPAGGFWELGNLNRSGLPNLWAGHGLMAPFDEEFYILINLAVGGVSGYFPESKGKPWPNHIDSYVAMTKFWEGRRQWLDSWKLGTEQYHYQVDYVKVWAL